eukprot:gnl/MRDRNA2_/MRDRNA2_80699_c0_seq11.p1 gnl/MRDRNA2_/MRDRNA2_80699_c0~~gnl/MRDRNA2_/MRDRNA2_80699_c0_seq11.p1  ORF type:complete len:310 (+),score=34.88 gnl/MRDRNA2_/MRDRNA2_80699_c0_seq11:225-1154(+)
MRFAAPHAAVLILWISHGFNADIGEHNARVSKPLSVTKGPMIQQALDCDSEPRWTTFWRLGVSHYSNRNFTLAKEDDALFAFAQSLVIQYSQQQHDKYAEEFVEILEGKRLRHPDGFCMYGFITAFFLFSLRGYQPSFGRALALLGRPPNLDFTSSTRWPIGALDFIVNLDVNLDRSSGEMMTYTEFLEKEFSRMPRIPPDFAWPRITLNPEGLSAKSRARVGMQQTDSDDEISRANPPVQRVSAIGCIMQPSYRILIYQGINVRPHLQRISTLMCFLAPSRRDEGDLYFKAKQLGTFTDTWLNDTWLN